MFVCNDLRADTPCYNGHYSTDITYTLTDSFKVQTLTARLLHRFLSPSSRFLLRSPSIFFLYDLLRSSSSKITPFVLNSIAISIIMNCKSGISPLQGSLNLGEIPGFDRSSSIIGILVNF
ncbi:uncharacterized protein [Spinacia oleracea]|uniref:Uncharacterized protein n=1 Tax=Spinacia oleracea TaxID=3562 RepID=A0ABM3QQQ5_SPIOL|nr:uncharacterized protein LOC130461570 [Spinacia oleracea]